jgi:hypothetical protein
MIAWMLYAAVIGALVGIAGLALERVAAARRVPMRFVWLATMIVSVGWAVASAVRRLLPDVASRSTRSVHDHARADARHRRPRRWTPAAPRCSIAR